MLPPRDDSEKLMPNNLASFTPLLSCHFPSSEDFSSLKLNQFVSIVISMPMFQSFSSSMNFSLVEFERSRYLALISYWH